MDDRGGRHRVWRSGPQSGCSGSGPGKKISCSWHLLSWSHPVCPTSPRSSRSPNQRPTAVLGRDRGDRDASRHGRVRRRRRASSRDKCWLFLETVATQPGWCESGLRSPQKSSLPRSGVGVSACDARNADEITSRYHQRELVPTLRVGMPSATLCVVFANAVPRSERDEIRSRFPRERVVRFQEVVSSAFPASSRPARRGGARKGVATPDCGNEATSMVRRRWCRGRLRQDEQDRQDQITASMVRRRWCRGRLHPLHPVSTGQSPRRVTYPGRCPSDPIWRTLTPDRPRMGGMNDS